MRSSVIMVAALTAVFACGCGTMDGGSMFSGKSGGKSRNVREAEELNREARLAELEASVRRLDSEIANLSAAVNDQLIRLRELSDTVSSEMDARSSDLVVMRRDLEQMRGSLKETDSRISALPGNFRKLLDEQQKSIMSSVDGRIASRNQSSGLSGEFYEHEVKSGETVSEIAHAYKVSVSDIVRANKLKDASSIRVGQKLLVPVR